MTLLVEGMDLVLIATCLVAVVMSVRLTINQRYLKRITETEITFRLMQQLRDADIRWWRERALRAERERDALQAALDQEKDHARTAG